jgi:hypothetical protein
MTAPLDDELLKKIATGSGRTYPHEGKAMAEELIKRRAVEAAAKLGSTQPIPYPWLGGGPIHP